MLRVMTIVGTRPEIIRLSRIIPKLDASFKPRPGQEPEAPAEPADAGPPPAANGTNPSSGCAVASPEPSLGALAWLGLPLALAWRKRRRAS